MDQTAVFGLIKQILMKLDQLSLRLQEKTDELTRILSGYSIETSNPEDILGIITSRETLIAEIQIQQKELSKLEKQIENGNTDSYDDAANKFKQIIISRISGVLSQDRFNSDQIFKLQKLASRESKKIKKGMKFTKGYNIFPHRKSIFLDIAN